MDEQVPVQQPENEIFEAIQNEEKDKRENVDVSPLKNSPYSVRAVKNDQIIILIQTSPYIDREQ